MQPTERIEVRKIYLGSAARFGIFYGAIFGLILGIIILILSLVLNISIGTGLFGFDGTGFFLAGIYFVFYTIIIFLTVFIGALIYNLVAKIGGRLDIGLAEKEQHMKGSFRTT